MRPFYGLLIRAISFSRSFATSPTLPLSSSPPFHHLSRHSCPLSLGHCLRNCIYWSQGRPFHACTAALAVAGPAGSWRDFGVESWSCCQAYVWCTQTRLVGSCVRSKSWVVLSLSFQVDLLVYLGHGVRRASLDDVKLTTPSLLPPLSFLSLWCWSLRSPPLADRLS